MIGERMKNLRDSAPDPVKTKSSRDQGGSFFQIEQETFAIQPAAVTGQRAVFTNHTMTRNDDGNGVAPIGEADRTHGLGVADATRLFAVADRFAVGNVEERLPDAELKRGALQIERHVERAQFPGKIRVELHPYLAKRRIVGNPSGLQCNRVQINAGQSFRGGEQRQRADRRRHRALEKNPHVDFWAVGYCFLPAAMSIRLRI